MKTGMLSLPCNCCLWVEVTSQLLKSVICSPTGHHNLWETKKLAQCGANVVPLYMKGCIYHFAKWHIHPFISKGTTLCDAVRSTSNTLSLHKAVLVMAQCRWRRPIVGTALQCLPTISQQQRDTEPMLIWCWASVADGGSTSNQHWLYVSSFDWRLYFPCCNLQRWGTIICSWYIGFRWIQIFYRYLLI